MKPSALATALATMTTFAACKGQGEPSGPGNQVVGQSVETRAQEASGQQPAFAGQTRAPFKTANVAFTERVIAKGLASPWALAFLPDGTFLVTEKAPAALRIIGKDGSRSAPVSGLPAVDIKGQGGLLDVVLAPDFATTTTIFFSYAEPRDGGNGTAVASAKLVREGAGAPILADVKVVWRMLPTLDSDKHFGSRLVFAKDGNLFITTGERSIMDGRKQAQDLKSAFGKVIRIKPDGSVPSDNPFVGKPDVQPEIWSYGHRNIQAAALHPVTGALWEVEHGARGGDEINVPVAGKDYGWPTITYGIEYTGGAIGDGKTQEAGMEQPVYYWDPVIAPSGMAFYDADLFPAWKGSLFVGSLVGTHLARLSLEGEKIVGEERLLVDRGRIRDVRVGPDGGVYVLTDAKAGELIELLPASRASN